jgi:uncharacterized protein YutE (UPF0331/DUF86 family)
MVNPEVVQKRIEKVQEYLDFLEKIKEEYSREEFKKEPMVYGSAERFLQLCIEALMDIGAHIVADENLGRVDIYSDIPKLLSQHGYISEEEKNLFIKIIGFRNILVHDYLEVDLDITYEIIKNNLIDLRKLIRKYTMLL